MRDNGMVPFFLRCSRMSANVFCNTLRIAAAALAVSLMLSVTPLHAQTDARAAFNAGNAALRAGHAKQAVSDFEQFTHAEPGVAIGWFNLGLAQEQAGQLDDSLVALDHAAKLDPTLRGVNLFRGIVAYKLNQLAAAQTALTRATHRTPANAMAWMWLGVTELAQNQPDAAAAALDRAAKLDPKNIDILYHRGRAHLLVAKQSYDAMFKLDPNSWRVHEVLAQSDAEAYRTVDAIQEFQDAIRAAPTEPGLHEELGDALWTDGKLQQADAAYSAELAIDPNDPVTLYKLGSLRVTNNEPVQGIPLLEKALKLDPTLVDAHYYLGRGLAELGQKQAAIAQFQLATNPKSSEDLQIMSWYRLAMLYRGMGEPQQAAQALATFRRMRQARSQRQQGNFQQRGRDQLPHHEKIPTGDVAAQ